MQLYADIHLAMSLLEQLAIAEQQIVRVAQRIDGIRAQEVNYQYPLLPGDFPAPKNQFKLDEEGGNSDPLIAAARVNLEQAKQFVLRGELNEANLAQTAVVNASITATALIDAVMDAKALTEQKVLSLRETFR